MKFLEMFMKKNESVICLGLSFLFILFLVNNVFSLEGFDMEEMDMEEMGMSEMDAEEDGAVSMDETVAEEIQEQGDKNKTNSDKIATKLRNLIDKYDNHTHPHPLGETDPTEKTEGDAGIDPTEME